METQETATLGGGCFWCLEAVYQELNGVSSIVSGYMGGEISNPTYNQVCSGNTGHAEVVQVTFDNNVVSFREVLEVFFATHDPTTMDRQGNDVGSQYRSVIFFHSDEQQQIAREVIRQLTSEHAFREPIVTEVVPIAPFFPAEGYHQNYFVDNPRQPYCQFVVSPKLTKFRQHFAEKRRAVTNT